MIRSDKTTGFDVIPVPAGSISSSRSQDGQAEITVSVPHCNDEPAQYYVVKRPDAVDEAALKSHWMPRSWRYQASVSSPVTISHLSALGKWRQQNRPGRRSQ